MELNNKIHRIVKKRFYLNLFTVQRHWSRNQKYMQMAIFFIEIYCFMMSV